jgi:hypothetical protein
VTTKTRMIRVLLHDIWWLWLRLSMRRFVAGIMLIMGLGRLGFYTTSTLSTALTGEQYGILLVVLGLALWPVGRLRLAIGGRLIAALAAILMAGMAWDVGKLGVTLLIEAWMALALLQETFTSHDC